MSRPLCFWLCLFFSLAACQTARAQVTDTTRVAPPDSISTSLPDSTNIPSQAEPDSLNRPVEYGPPVPFLDTARGLVVNDTLPTRHPALDPVSLLGEIPGSFVYDFGASGWPDGWSPFGLDPSSVSVSFNEIPFDNALMGRPDYELLPFSLLQSFRLQAARFGQPLAVNTRLRSYDVPRPQTHIRYRSSNNGLNSVLVVHSQQRRLRFAKRPGVLGIALAYGGHGANGEYPGSKLEGARQLLTRLRYKHPWGSLELLNMQNRRRLGAHGGVQPFSTNFNSIYNRLGASVADPTAIRQDIRNDLMLTARSHVIGSSSEPFTLTGYWTAQTFRYVNGDTLQTRSSRLGYRAEQAFTFSPAHVTVQVEGWSEGIRDDSTALGDSLLARRNYTHFSLLTQLQWKSLNIAFEPGLHVLPDDSFIGGRLRIDKKTTPIDVFAEASYSGKHQSWVQEYGWGDSFLPLETIVKNRITLLQAGIHARFGPFDLGLKAFIHRNENPVDAFTISQTDSIQVKQLADEIQWSGVTADFGFRRDRRRGIYLTLTPTLYQFNDASASTDHQILSQSIPDAYVRGRLGLKYVLFQGDLDMNLYGQGRLWSPFQSRTLHPETGLLVLREDGAREVEASAALDVVLEAGVRTAKIFVSFENLLSGTTLVPGNMLVPNYPLPARRFRFGVFWPIQD